MSYRQYLHSLSAGALAAGAALVMAACSGTSNTNSPTSAATTTQVSEDVAEATSVDVTADVTDMGGTSGDANSESATPMRVMGSSASAPGQVTTRDVCTIGTTTASTTFPTADPRDTVAYTHTWEFFDASGCENAYLAGTTDTIQYTFNDTLFLNGKAEHWHGHRYASRAHTLTADTAGLGTALNTAFRFWNGTGTVTDTDTFVDSRFNATYTWVNSDTMHNVSFPHPRDLDAYPLGGTWTRWVNGNATFSGGTTGTATVQRHIIVTFSTDQTTGQGSVDATLQVLDVNTGTVVETCTVDLSVGQIVPGSCVS